MQYIIKCDVIDTSCKSNYYLSSLVDSMKWISAISLSKCIRVESIRTCYINMVPV